jgi:hypothetical protein
MKALLILSFLFTTLFCYSQNDSTVKYISFEKELYKIQYPDNWSLDTSRLMGTELFFFSPKENDADRFRENLNLYIQDLKGKNIDLVRFAKISEKQVNELVTDGVIYSSKKITTANSEYYKMIYGMTQGIFKLKLEQYYFIKNEKAFVLTFTTEEDKFEDYKNTGEKILNSFLLKK